MALGALWVWAKSVAILAQALQSAALILFVGSNEGEARGCRAYTAERLAQTLLTGKIALIAIIDLQRWAPYLNWGLRTWS